MKALQYDQFGDLDVLQFQDIPVPEPGEDEVQVKVAGYGVNPVDYKISSGAMQHLFPTPLPAVLGSEFSGVITKVGPGVSDFQEGDHVYGTAAKPGAAAEYAVAKIGSFAKAPTSVDLPDAAAIPLAGQTAYQAIVTHVDLGPESRVLIHGGAGGVGTFAIQFAKWKGAYVFATASAANLNYLKELGADEAIDYQSQKFEDIATDVDLVVDTIGGETTSRSLKAMKTGATLVALTGPPDAEAFKAEGKIAILTSMKPNPDQLVEIAGLVESVQLRPVITVELPFERVKEAIAESMKGHTRGKIVVKL